MASGTRNIAVFDFDGTLTNKDTMFDFIEFACGRTKLWLGLIIFAPMIAIMFMKIIDNNRCKQILLSWYFKGMKYRDFKTLGVKYASKVQSILRPDTIELLHKHQAKGDTIYVISASIKEWVAPICMSLGINKVLATEFESDDNGILTGKFSKRNCFGQEKVNRLQEIEPNRSGYYLYAYGDSRGDREMFAFSNEYIKL